MAQIFEAISNPNNKIFKYVKRADILSEEEEKKENDRINELNKSIESQKLLDLKVSIEFIIVLRKFQGLDTYNREREI
jgi:hypothetical protein